MSKHQGVHMTLGRWVIEAGLVNVPPEVSNGDDHFDDDEWAMAYELEDPWRRHSSLEGCQTTFFRRR